MEKFAKILLYVTAVILLSWFLPWIYNLLTPAPAGEAFCGFSPVSAQWTVSRSLPGEKPVIRLAEAFSSHPDDGEIITQDMRDLLIPQLYYRQLMAHDRLPDTIRGKAVSAHSLKMKEVFFTSSPRDIVKNNPGIWLMMESMPARVDLSDPSEAFRITGNGMEFIRISDNTVNTDRSHRFTEAMKARGFSFPATDLSANVSSKKAYDEGYLMIDAERKVFHVKQQGGRPYVAAVNLPAGIKASKVFIWEEADRSLLGMLTDTENRPYIIYSEGHEAVRLPDNAGTIDPRKESIVVMGNLFNITMRITSAESTRWRAFDSDSLKLIGALDFPKDITAARQAGRYIFPFDITFTSVYDSLAYPRSGGFSLLALPLDILLGCILLWLGIRRKSNQMKWCALITVFCGLYSFIPSFLFTED